MYLNQSNPLPRVKLYIRASSNGNTKTTYLQVCLLKTQDVKVLSANQFICRKPWLHNSLKSINVPGQNLHTIGISAKWRRSHCPWIISNPLRSSLLVGKASPGLRLPGRVTTLRRCGSHVRRRPLGRVTTMLRRCGAHVRRGRHDCRNRSSGTLELTRHTDKTKNVGDSWSGTL